jgi:hypothetical protein
MGKRKLADPTKTASDGTRRGRPPGKGKPGKAVATKLTDAQERFILCYMVRKNATRAYMDSHPDASYFTAACEGSKLARDPRVSKEINRLLAEERKSLVVDGKRVTAILAAMATTPLSAVFDKEGGVIHPANMSESVSYAVKKIKRKEIFGKPAPDQPAQVIGHTIEVEMHDRVAPLRLLGLELGMFTEKVEHTADDELVEAIRAGRERALAERKA